MITFLIVLLSLSINTPALMSQCCRVASPVASVWTDPIQDAPRGIRPLYGFNKKCPDQNIPHHDTQVLYADRLIKLEEVERGGLFFYRVLIPSQLRYDKKTDSFVSYSGWVRADNLVLESPEYQKKFIEKNCLKIVAKPLIEAFTEKGEVLCEIPFAAVLPVLAISAFNRNGIMYDKVLLASGEEAFVSTQDLSPLPSLAACTRQELFDALKCFVPYFLDSGYVWGGCSAPLDTKAFISGVDCSSLLYLLFRALGLLIPRNASCQFKNLQKWPVEKQRALPGDMLFLRRIDHKNINHVLMIDEEDKLLETTGFSGDDEHDCCKRILNTERISGVSAISEGGCSSPEGDFYYLRFLSSQDALMSARDAFIGAFSL